LRFRQVRRKRGAAGLPVPLQRNSMLKNLLAGLVAVTLWSSGLAYAQIERTSRQIVRDVAWEVTRYSHYTIFDDVNVSVENGLVRLTGKVTMPHKRKDIERRVARVGGVREVQNELEVLPVSTFDDELRYRIARAIYGNPNFWNYAAMADPPIHILVEHGRVTLTGVVNSNVDRMLARSLAASHGALSVANELRTDTEAREAGRETSEARRGH
jgi:hyperosmotically inducible periplasmic protein